MRTIGCGRRDSAFFSSTLACALFGFFSLTGATPAHAGVGAGAYVTGTQTVSGNFVPGGSATYTVVLTNSGSTEQPDNPTSEFSESFMWPLGVMTVSASSGSGRFVTGKPSMVFWDGAIPVGGSVTITLTGTIDADVTVGQLISRAGTVYFDADGNGSNEGFNSTDDPSLPGPSDPTVFRIAGAQAPPVAAPTLSMWTAALLMIGLAGIGVLRRRWLLR